MKKILVAVSGGVDSMVLLHLLHKKGFEIGVVHINHNTRGQQNIDELTLVKNACNQLNVPFYLYSYIHDEENGNFQQSARQFRIDKYKELTNEYNYDVVALGHHYDDQLENILMNQGKLSPNLMKELTEVNGILLYRPNLNITKSEIYQIAKNSEIDYLEDPSNENTKYKRNKYRALLANMTYMQKESLYNEELEKNIKYTQNQRRLKSILDKRELNVEDIKSKEDIHIYLRLFDFENNISDSLLNSLFNTIKAQKNAKIDISVNVVFNISYGEIFLYNKASQHDEINNVQMLLEGENIFNNIKFTYNGNPSNKTIRTYKTEDEIKGKHTKKINRFFIDEKIPFHLRAHWPIIVDENDTIQYIPRKRDIHLKKLLGEYLYV